MILVPLWATQNISVAQGDGVVEGNGDPAVLDFFLHQATLQDGDANIGHDRPNDDGDLVHGLSRGKGGRHADGVEPVLPIERGVDVAQQRFRQQLRRVVPAALRPARLQSVGMADDDDFPADDVIAPPSGPLSRYPAQDGGMRAIPGKVFVASVRRKFQYHIRVKAPEVRDPRHEPHAGKGGHHRQTEAVGGGGHAQLS